MSGWQDRARVIQVETTAWLVVNSVLKPRYLIRRGPAVHKVTGETHILYRVDGWALDKASRRTVGWYETYQEAVDLVTKEIEAPDFRAPIVGEHRGTAITVEEQRERWEAGLDPRTGKPRRDEG